MDYNTITKVSEKINEALENNNELHRYTIDESKAIKAKYRAKLKEIKSSNSLII